MEGEADKTAVVGGEIGCNPNGYLGRRPLGVKVVAIVDGYQLDGDTGADDGLTHHRV